MSMSEAVKKSGFFAKIGRLFSATEVQAPVVSPNTPISTDFIPLFPTPESNFRSTLLLAAIRGPWGMSAYNVNVFEDQIEKKYFNTETQRNLIHPIILMNIADNIREYPNEDLDKVISHSFQETSSQLYVGGVSISGSVDNSLCIKLYADEGKTQYLGEITTKNQLKSLFGASAGGQEVEVQAQDTNGNWHIKIKQNEISEPEFFLGYTHNNSRLLVPTALLPSLGQTPSVEMISDHVFCYAKKSGVISCVDPISGIRAETLAINNEITRNFVRKLSPKEVSSINKKIDTLYPPPPKPAKVESKPQNNTSSSDNADAEAAAIFALLGDAANSKPYQYSRSLDMPAQSSQPSYERPPEPQQNNYSDQNNCSHSCQP